MKNLYGLLICSFIFYSAISANTLRVPSEYSTIQAGVDAATDGDIVLVADGTYTGDGNKSISFSGKDVVVQSENGPDACIIDCENSDMSIAFVINSAEGELCTIEGFTIRNASMGIWAYANSTPTIAKNIIENCGAGIYCSSDASPLIIGNTIRDNHNTGPFPQYGGGISLSWSAVTIVNNLIYSNISKKGGGIYCSNSPSAKIINNTIIDNAALYGGGVYLDESPLKLTNNIIAFSEYEPALDLRIFCYKFETHANYDGAKLASIDYTFAIQNKGAGGIVYFKSTSSVGGRGIDTSFQMVLGERRTLHINSKVNEFGDYGGINLDITIEGDLLNVQEDGLSTFNPESYYLTMAVDPDAVPASKEIIEIGAGVDITFCDVFGDGEGNYYSGDSDNKLEPTVINGTDGNVSGDPLFDVNYSLTAGSPCIDMGTPDTTGLFLPSVDMEGLQRILDGDGNGAAIVDIGAYEFEISVDIKKTDNILSEFKLNQNYPNPFNPATVIEYSIPVSSRQYAVGSRQYQESSIQHQVSVSLKIYDVLGRQVATLVNDHQRPGNYEVQFDASKLSSGVYYYQLNAGSFIQSKKMLLLK